MTEAEQIRRLKRALWGSLVVLLFIAIVVVAVLLLPRPDRIDPTVDQPSQVAPILTPVEYEAPSPRLSDITRSSGIDFVHVNGATGERLLPETMGGGVAFLDFENDGDQDLIFVNSDNWSWSDSGGIDSASALYLNQGDGTFEKAVDVGLEDPLYGMGIAVGDFDGDSYVDVYLTAVGSNRLLRNEKGVRFQDITESTGVSGAHDAWSTGASFFDYDQDGDLDLFVCNYVVWSQDRDREVDYRLAGIGRAYGPPTDFAGTNSYLFRNDGGRFKDVSQSSGIEIFNESTGVAVGKGLAVVTADINGDSFDDIVVANDTVRNFAFLNQGDGSFVESGISLGLAFDTAGLATGAMGIDIAHFANNDAIGLAIGNFANEMSSFYVRRKGESTFSDSAIVAGVGPASRRALTFGLLFLDYDLDGRPDLFAANGHVEPEINRVQSSQEYAQSAQIWWNCGDDCNRRYIPVDSKGTDWGEYRVARGAAYADIDGDGDLDVVLTNVGSQPTLLRNDTPREHSWIRIELRQNPPNVYAIGARVEIQTPDEHLIRFVSPTRSYLSQVETPVTFGLDSGVTETDVTVHWPDGSTTTADALTTNQAHRIVKLP